MAIGQFMMTAATAAALLAESSSSDDEEEEQTDHRTLPREKRARFDHGRALESIKTDYLNLDSTFIGSQFKLFFRISRRRFQAILEDVGNANKAFYQPSIKKGPSVEARLLLPLKVLAYGVAPHAFVDYFL